jgi:hypothetical protein
MGRKSNLVRTKKIVNEGKSASAVLTFKDENGDEIVPSTAKYTLYDFKSDTVINDRTDVDMPGSTATRTIELTGSDNVIVNDALFLEEHRLYVEFTYAGGAKSGSVEAQFHVANMRKE